MFYSLQHFLLLNIIQGEQKVAVQLSEVGFRVYWRSQLMYSNYGITISDRRFQGHVAEVTYAT
jgi:hypothetical protein